MLMIKKVHVAIVDDMVDMIDEAKKAVNDFFALAEMKDVNFEIEEFNDYHIFLEKIENGKSYDLVLLDIQMPEGREGFKVAQRLGELEKPPIYFFLTAHDEYLPDGYEFFAAGYLLKPINQENFNRNMLRVMKKILAVSPRIAIEHLDGVTNVYTDSIMYIELIARKSQVTLEDGRKLITDKTIYFWTTQLTTQKFTRLSQSCMINFQHADDVGTMAGIITMDDNKKFKIPIRKVKEVKNSFYNYLESGV